jgi:hypothetical protein
MLIYEKDNKLNINFDNEISENPDLQIGKNGDKTEVLVDGSSNPTIPVPVLPEDVGKTIIVNEDGSYALANAGGSNAPLILEFATIDPYTVATPLSEIKAAIDAGRDVRFLAPNGFVIQLGSYKEDAVFIQVLSFSGGGGQVVYDIDANGWSYMGK